MTARLRKIRMSYKTRQFLGQTAFHQSRFRNGSFPQVSSAAMVMGPLTCILDRYIMTVVCDEGPLFQSTIFAKLQFNNKACTTAVYHFIKNIIIPIYGCILAYSYKNKCAN